MITFLLAVAPLFTADTPTETLNRDRKGAWTATTSYPRYGDTDLGKFAYRQIGKDCTLALGDWMADASAARKTARRGAPPYEFLGRFTPSFTSDQVISGFYMQFSDTQGAHPTTTYWTRTFVDTGDAPRAIVLKDVLRSGISGTDVMQTLVLDALNEVKAKRNLPPVNAIPGDYTDSFYVKGDGLAWVFPPYAVGPYAEGEYFVILPWSRIRAVLNEFGPLRSVLPATPPERAVATAPTKPVDQFPVDLPKVTPRPIGKPVAKPDPLPQIDPDLPQPVVDKPATFTGNEVLTISSNGASLTGSPSAFTVNIAGNLTWKERVRFTKSAIASYFVSQKVNGKYQTAVINQPVTDINSPMPFGVNFQLKGFNPKDALNLTVQVTSGGKRLLRTARPIRIPSEGWDGPKDIPLIKG